MPGGEVVGGLPSEPPADTRHLGDHLGEHRRLAEAVDEQAGAVGRLGAGLAVLEDRDVELGRRMAALTQRVTDLEFWRFWLIGVAAGGWILATAAMILAVLG